MVRILAIDRSGLEHTIEGEQGKSLMRNLKEIGGMDVAAICGGNCSCGTCHVLVDPEWYGRLPNPGVEEIELIQDEPSFVPGASRLSCQIRLEQELDGILVTLAQSE